MKDNELSQVADSGGAPMPCPAKSLCRILVVDDDCGTRQRSLDVLAGAGYDVESVNDGAAGWDALQSKSYDLIITDNKMPKMTGVEMIEKLRAARMAVPVILATACAPSHEFDRKPWLNPDATLRRPSSNDDLLAAVKRVLRTDVRAHQLAGTPAEDDQAGLRPSSGTATTAGGGRPQLSKALGGSESAAPEDGRNPALRPGFIPGDGNDVRKETRAEKTLRASEISYRRLFEAAKDGILILDVDTGRINDVNPFLIELLGFSHSEMVGKTVGELSPFKDLVSNQAMLERLQRDGYVRYDDLPLETSDGRHISDYTLPTFDGMSALKIAQVKWPAIPLIFVSGTLGEERAIDSLKNGATDYVLKDRLARLVPAVRRALQEVKQRVGRQQAEAKRREYGAKIQVLSRRLVEVQETERRHLARELHEEIGQALTVAQMHLQALLQSSGAVALAPRLNESLTVVERVLEQVDDISFNLRPSLLDELGLEPALRCLTERQAALAGLQAEVRVGPLEQRLDPIIETQCFRIAQAALTNVVKHAKARAVSVEVSENGEQLNLSVRDDGIGFDVAGVRQQAVRGASLGLLGMEERATLAGGGLQYHAAPGQGTEVRAWFPLKWADFAI